MDDVGSGDGVGRRAVLEPVPGREVRRVGPEAGMIAP
jgi:hypothetical protein